MRRCPSVHHWITWDLQDRCLRDFAKNLADIPNQNKIGLQFKFFHRFKMETFCMTPLKKVSEMLSFFIVRCLCSWRGVLDNYLSFLSGNDFKCRFVPKISTTLFQKMLPNYYYVIVEISRIMFVVFVFYLCLLRVPLYRPPHVCCLIPRGIIILKST